MLPVHSLSCGNSTCLKTPQDYSKEGRLKPFFANNVDIPFARARSLKPVPAESECILFAVVEERILFPYLFFRCFKFIDGLYKFKLGMILSQPSCFLDRRLFVLYDNS